MSNNQEESIIKLKEQFPNLIIQERYNGYVLNIEADTVYVRLSGEKEDYDCEIDKKNFPPEDLNENIAFLLIMGEINKKSFTHINYFYWTPEDLLAAEKRAKELSNFLF